MAERSWYTEQGYVRGSKVRDVALELRFLGVVNHKLTLQTLRDWVVPDGRGVGENGRKSNQPVYRRWPFPIPAEDILWKTQVSHKKKTVKKGKRGQKLARPRKVTVSHRVQYALYPESVTVEVKGVQTKINTLVLLPIWHASNQGELLDHPEYKTPFEWAAAVQREHKREPE